MLLRLSRGMTPSCLCYKPLQDLKSYLAMVILTWLQKRFYWFLLKMTPKWNFSSTMPQTGHGNQVKCYQISTICLITAGQRIDREIMTKINKLFNHLEFQFCEMFHCMVVTYKVKNERMTKRNVCLQKA